MKQTIILGNINLPKGMGVESFPHNVKEAITREQSLRALTINVARQWRQ